MPTAGAAAASCIFCQIVRSETSTKLLHSDEKVVAFQDINPSAYSSDGKVKLQAVSLGNLGIRNKYSDSWHCVLIAGHVSAAVSQITSQHVVVSGFQSMKHYLVIPVEHIATVRDLQRRSTDYALVTHMLTVGQTILHRDAPHSKYRFGFHQPPFNSVDHLHLHCLALPYTPSWRHLKYLSLGPFGGFIEADKLLEKIKPP